MRLRFGAAAAPRGPCRRPEIAAGRAAGREPTGIDRYGFVLSFKGVLLEGLEVAFIVVTLGANEHDVPLATIAAGAAVVIVVIAGLAARAPLSRAPENTLKFGVGVMLTAFGIFWGAEGAGARWPGGDAALLAVVPLLLAFSILVVWAFRRTNTTRAPGVGEAARA